LIEGAEVEVIELDNELVNIDPAMPSDFANVKVHRVANRAARSLGNELLALFSLKPRYSALFGNTEMQARCQEIIAQSQPDMVVAESIWAMPVVPQAFLSKTTFVIHDVAQHFFFEMARTTENLPRRILFALDWLRIREFESGLFARHEGNFMFLTANDLAWYSRRYPFIEGRSSIATNRLYVQALERAVNLQDPFVLFPGSLDFAQNSVAMKWFAEGVWPCIEMAGKLKVIVTGKCSEKNRKHFQGYNGISLVGEVSRKELDQLFASCVCVISPIISGTGIKIKILEATQRGVPVVATATSAKGITSELCHKAADDTVESYRSAFDKFMTL
jgi:glycosyltransferase involved in cell wall biosynthesis